MMIHRPNRIPTYDAALLLVVAYRSVQNVVNEVLSRHGIVTTQWIILGHLYDVEQAWRFSDIAAMLQVENPLVSRLMELPVKKQWIAVTSPDDDRRIKLATLTAGGARLVEAIEVELARHLEESFPEISDKELSDYLATLKKFAKCKEYT